MSKVLILSNFARRREDLHSFYFSPHLVICSLLHLLPVSRSGRLSDLVSHWASVYRFESKTASYYTCSVQSPIAGVAIHRRITNLPSNALLITITQAGARVLIVTSRDSLLCPNIGPGKYNPEWTTALSSVASIDLPVPGQRSERSATLPGGSGHVGAMWKTFGEGIPS